MKQTPAPQGSPPSRLSIVLAYSVHVFTALGIVAGLLALVAVAEHQWVTAFWWLFAAQVIDGVDGTFARLCKVEDVLPNMNGKTMDGVIDFATYSLIPAFFLCTAFRGDSEAPVYLLPEGWRFAVSALVVFSSALYYAKEGMISKDFYFIGFPVLWNFVAFLLFFVVELPAWWNAAIVLGLVVLQFLPVKFVYPSRSKEFFWANLLASFACSICCAIVLWLYPAAPLVFRAGAVIAIAWLALAGLLATFRKTPKL